MASSFLIARRDNAQLWACIDPDTLCTAPLIGERRFAAYLAPFGDEGDAKQALLGATFTYSVVGSGNYQGMVVLDV